MTCDGAIGDDCGPDPRPQRRDTLAERGQNVAADHDVIGAIAERNVYIDEVGVFQRRGHGTAPTLSPPWVARPPQSFSCSASMHSSTILSCGTSRDQIVR